MHLEMATNRLRMFVKAEKFNVLLFFFFFFFFFFCVCVCVYVFFFFFFFFFFIYIYLMSPVSDLTCLST